MQIIHNQMVVMTDIDDTLVKWTNPNVPGLNKIEITFPERKVYLEKHQYHIDLIRMYKDRGYFVVAWSNNGPVHVEKVITALGLEKCIDLVMSKPIKYLDDREKIEEILGTRVFCEDITSGAETKILVPYRPAGY
jgi:FMN phosphatase YigB (HAD superfamily)